ncbi:hypothetical protein ACVWYO_004559 [Sphingomonas sp. UYP23]
MSDTNSRKPGNRRFPFSQNRSQNHFLTIHILDGVMRRELRTHWLCAGVHPGSGFGVAVGRLNAAGCEHIATDKASGASIVRPGLTEALGKAGKGDTLVIWKLDRLGRSMKGLVDLAAELSARGIELRSLTDGIVTATHTGRLVFHILRSIAEMERDLIRERTMAGLAARRKAGGAEGVSPS